MLKRNYPRGSTITISASFKDENGDLIDPERVLFHYSVDQGTQYTSEYGITSSPPQDPTINRTGVGLYNVELFLMPSGRWATAWQSLVNGASFHEEKFTVEPTALEPEEP